MYMKISGVPQKPFSAAPFVALYLEAYLIKLM